MLTAALVLRCVEEGRLSLDDRIGQFKPDSPDANATIRQVLRSSASDNLAFDYRPERLEPLARAIRACTDDSFRETLANLLDRLAMIDSVPGPDIIHPELLPEGIPSPSAVERYKRVLERLATPYAVDRRGAASPSQYSATTLTPASGLISTVRDFAQFDLALKKGVLLRPETLAAAWRAPLGRGPPAPAARSRLVRADLQGRDDRLAVRRQHERLIVSGGDGAGARDDADSPGEQRRPCEAVRADDGRSDGLAVRAAVPRTLCPVGESALRSCESAFWHSRFFCSRRPGRRPNGRSGRFSV